MCTPWHKQRLSVLSRSVGIPSLLVSGIQNGTEPPPLLFSLTITFRAFGSLPSRKVQSSEVDEVFTRQLRNPMGFSCVRFTSESTSKVANGRSSLFHPCGNSELRPEGRSVLRTLWQDQAGLMLIRAGTYDDVPALLQLEQRTRTPGLLETALRDWLATPGATILVAVRKVIVGVAYAAPAAASLIEGAHPTFATPGTKLHVEVVVDPMDPSAGGVDASLWSAVLLLCRDMEVIATRSRDETPSCRSMIASGRVSGELMGPIARGAALVRGSPAEESGAMAMLVHFPSLRVPTHNRTRVLAEGRASPAPSTAETTALVRHAMESLGLPRADGGMNMQLGFLDLGLDSDDTLELVAQLNERLPFRLNETVLFEHPSPTQLSGLSRCPHMHLYRSHPANPPSCEPQPFPRAHSHPRPCAYPCERSIPSQQAH